MTDFEIAWNRVMAYINGSVSGLSPISGVTLDLGVWNAPDREPIDEEDDPTWAALWISASEHFLLDAQWTGDDLGQAEGILHGNMTPRALAATRAQLSDICNSAATTVRFATSTGNETPSFSRLVDAHGKIVVAFFIDSFLRPSKGKMSQMERSCHNAVHLLIEADKTTNDAVSMSLSVAAVEALLCDGTAIAEQFSQRAAVLLETNRHQRSIATERLKKLYNERSRTLHGDGMESTNSTRQTARRLASGVIAAVVQWQDHRRKTGDAAERQSFVSELKEVTMSGQSVVGIDPRLSSCLPKDSTA
jgi:hypothetical protein